MSPFVDLGSGFSVNYLAFDGAGNLYTDDVTGDRILAITPGRSVSTFATLPSDADPYDLAFDRLGNLYVTNVRSFWSYLPNYPQWRCQHVCYRRTAPSRLHRYGSCLLHSRPGTLHPHPSRRRSRQFVDLRLAKASGVGQPTRTESSHPCSCGWLFRSKIEENSLSPGPIFPPPIFCGHLFDRDFSLLTRKRFPYFQKCDKGANKENTPR